MLQTKDKLLQAKCNKLQAKSEANPRRPDTFTELLAGSPKLVRNETTNILSKDLYMLYNHSIMV